MREHSPNVEPLKRRWQLLIVFFKPSNDLSKCLDGYFFWSLRSMISKTNVAKAIISWIASKVDTCLLPSRDKAMNHRHHPFFKRLPTIFSLFYFTSISYIEARIRQKKYDKAPENPISSVLYRILTYWTISLLNF